MRLSGQVRKMSDEHVKLVAKIQHFYDVMISRLREIEDNSLTSVDKSETLAYKEKSIELNYLSFEFAKTFDTFLYKESSDKR